MNGEPQDEEEGDVQHHQQTPTVTTTVTTTTIPGRRCCDGCGFPPRPRQQQRQRNTHPSPPSPSLEEEEDAVIPLRRCSRCHQTWYHDSECQKRHYPTHKKDCHSTTASTTTTIPRRHQGDVTESASTSTTTTITTIATRSTTVGHGPSRPEGKVRIQPASHTTRGNCLVATDLIQRGERICPPPPPQFSPPVLHQGGAAGTRSRRHGDGGGAVSWNALVAPVLLERQRSTRCALCFGKLVQDRPPLRYKGNSLWRGDRPPPYVMLFCSRNCRTRGSEDHGLDREESLVLAMYEDEEEGRRPGPPMIFSTAILLYRLMNASNAIQNEFNRLQCHLPHGRYPTDENEQHTRAVMATVAAMGPVYHPVVVEHEFRAMIHRIKINGFSIADGESIALGIGVFSLPSFINHSCQPNVIQTFLHGHENQPPTLWLTAYHDIPSGHELTISYLDNSSPRHIRQGRLLEDYYFLCDCPACCAAAGDITTTTTIMERESSILGVRCPSCHEDNATNSLLQVVLRVDHHHPLLDPAASQQPLSLLCSVCGGSTEEYSDTTLLQATKFKWLWEEMPHDDECYDDDNLLKRKQDFQNMKMACFRGSWYQEEMGDRLVHAFLDKLGQSSAMDEQEMYATEALQILNYLVFDDDDGAASFRRWSSTSLEFRRSIQWFQMAKLRLFLYPDPTKAIHLLEKAYSFLSMYYPSSHELILDLMATMQQARG
jgi:SET domain/MYND finger